MSEKQAYVQKIQAQLDQWSGDIDKLKAKADKGSAEAKLAYYKQIDELRVKQDAARAKLEKLKQSSEDAWKDLKSGVESAWDDLSAALTSANSRFK